VRGGGAGSTGSPRGAAILRSRELASPLTGLALGTGYGLLCRWFFDTEPEGDGIAIALAGVSIAFLLLVPFGLGVLTAALAPPRERPPWLYWLLMPLVSAGLLLGASLLLAWEGAICIVMAAPIVLTMALMGGLAVGLVTTYRGRRSVRPGAVAGCLVLPFLFAPFEAGLPRPQGLRDVTTRVEIAAAPEQVWRELVRVPRITDAEQTPGLFHAIGIPRPLEATLSHEGVGALREAHFEGGLRFHERVTEWEPGRRLAFTIEIDPQTVSSAVLDRHVRVGGAIFDVTYGRFELEPSPRGTRLHLHSQHRLSTTLNAYAGLWSDAVMQDIQRNICNVIRSRSERARRVREES
jgi:uncharacterized protein YndB with AHSA1/START domain